MLDLTTLSNEYYEIRLLDGTELQLKRPTQGMFEYIIGIQNSMQAENQAEAITDITKLFVRVLNRNTDNKTFTVEQINEEYDFRTIGIVIQDYFAYWNKEVDALVDFQ